LQPVDRVSGGGSPRKDYPLPMRVILSKKIINSSHQRCKKEAWQPTTIPPEHKTNGSIFSRNTLPQKGYFFKNGPPSLSAKADRDDRICAIFTSLRSLIPY